MNLLDLPDNLLYYLIKNYLCLRDWCNLSSVCSRLRDNMQICWLEKRHLIIDKDLLSLNPMGSLKFHTAQDNLWPQRLYKTDTDNIVDAERVRELYKELWFLLKKCTRLQMITFCSSTNINNNNNEDCWTGERRTLGGSVLRLFCQRSFYMVSVLNLSNTMFSLHDLEETAPAFSNIIELRIENCRVYISRSRAWNEQNAKVLQQYVVGYQKIKAQMCQGVKVLLISCSQIFNELQWIYTGRAEFQSTGCIVYSFGREEVNTVYKLTDTNVQWWDRIYCCY